MRNMSFQLTVAAVRGRTKTVTRRLGWSWLEPGTLLRSTCKREVHQDGPRVPSGNFTVATWRHCDDKSPRCDGATSDYPASTADIVGDWCGADAGGGR